MEGGEKGKKPGPGPAEKRGQEIKKFESHPSPEKRKWVFFPLG